MPTVATIVSIVLVILFVVLSIWENGLFKFHPSSVAISYFGCMFHAIYAFSNDGIDPLRPVPRRQQIIIHSVLQLTAIASLVFGFISIYLSKDQRQKPHFTTWHGLLGLIAVIWSVIQAFGGLFLTIFQRFLRTLGLTYAQLRLYHATSGALLFTFSCFVFILGLFSNWFKSKMPKQNSVYYIIVYLLTSTMLYLAHKTVDQVKNRYVRRKVTTK